MTSYSQLHHYFIHSPPCRSIAYSNDSCDNEIFSTPPSSPQPQINIQKSTQTNSPNRYGQNHQPFFIFYLLIFFVNQFLNCIAIDIKVNSAKHVRNLLNASWKKSCSVNGRKRKKVRRFCRSGTGNQCSCV